MPKTKKVNWREKVVDIYFMAYSRLVQFYHWLMPWLEKWLQAVIFFIVKSYQKSITFYIMTLARTVDYLVKAGYESRRQNYIKQSYHMCNQMKLDNRKEGKFLNRLKRVQLRYYKRYLKLGHKHIRRRMRKFSILVKLNKMKVILRTYAVMLLFKLKKFYKRCIPYDIY